MSDIFISYRREGGSTTARLICKLLEDAGFRCFFDSESLSFGSFAESIKDNLRNSRNFILILSPGALDRCHSPEDWVRQEISLALELFKAGQIKRIIPLFTNGVTGFPSDLPADIRAISEQNAVELNHKDFDSNFARLRERIYHEKRDQLVNIFLNLHKAEPEDLKFLLQTFTECLSPEEQLHALKSNIKMHWSGDIRVLLEGYHESTLRQICLQLGICQEGGHDALINHIESWLNHRKPIEPKNLISKKILECYLRYYPQDLPSFCDQLGLSVDKRSPQKMRAMLSNRLDLELDFSSLYFDDLKLIASEALGEDKIQGLKRQALVEALSDAYNCGRKDL